MSDMLPNAHNSPYGAKRRKRKYGPINPDRSPDESDLDSQTPEQAERFPMWTPEQVLEETRNVRIDVSFADVARIRAQFEMVQECVRVVIGIAKEHGLGSVQQRVRMRQEWDSLRRALARFNGRKPRFDTFKP